MLDFDITLNEVTINSKEILKYVRNCRYNDAVLYMIEKTNCSTEEANEVVEEFKSIFIKNYHYKSEKETKKNTKAISSQKQQNISSNIPKCPTCGSTNIKKITAGQKLGGMIGFGIFSKTARSQFECKNCGYKW